MKFWVVQKKQNNFLAAKFKKRGNEITLLEGPREIELKELKGQNVIGLCKSLNFYFSRETYPETSKEILTLQIQDRLQELGFFERPPSIRYRRAKYSLSQNEIEIAAINEVEIGNYFEELINKEIKPIKIVPEQLAIAFLTLKESQKFLISIYLSEDTLWTFITGRGEIFYFRNIEIDPEFGTTEELLEEAILTTIDYAQRILKIEIEGIVKYGKNKDIIPETAIPEYKPNLSFIKNIPNDELTNNPIIFGAYYIPREFNFIPEEHIFILKSIKIATYIAYFLTICIIANYLLWVKFGRKVEVLEKETKKLKEEIYRKSNILSKILNSKKRENFEKIKKIMDEYQKTLKVNLFLEQIESIKPESTDITTLEIIEENGRFRIYIKLRDKGDLNKVSKDFNHFYRLIGKRLAIQEDIYSYNENTKEGLLEIKAYY